MLYLYHTNVSNFQVPHERASNEYTYEVNASDMCVRNESASIVYAYDGGQSDAKCGVRVH